MDSLTAGTKVVFRTHGGRLIKLPHVLACLANPGFRQTFRKEAIEPFCSGTGTQILGKRILRHGRGGRPMSVFRNREAGGCFRLQMQQEGLGGGWRLLPSWRKVLRQDFLLCTRQSSRFWLKIKWMWPVCGSIREQRGQSVWSCNGKLLAGRAPSGKGVATLPCKGICVQRSVAGMTLAGDLPRAQRRSRPGEFIFPKVMNDLSVNNQFKQIHLSSFAVKGRVPRSRCWAAVATQIDTHEVFGGGYYSAGFLCGLSLFLADQQYVCKGVPGRYRCLATRF